MIHARSPVLISLLSFLLVGFLLTDVIEARGGGGSVSVRGYYRKDGTYVAPHYRSSPDGNPYNNWSFPGNTNPYTGKTATGDPSTYLERHQRQGSSSVTTNPSPSITPPTTPSAPVTSIVVPPNLQPTPDRRGLSTTLTEGMTSLSANSSNFLKTLQLELKKYGFDPGSIDGQMSNATQQALKRFQYAHGLSASGDLDIATLTKLVERNLQR
jgi:hypothetical protein